MNDSDIFDRYDEYLKGLTQAELESIYHDIDRQKYPDRFKTVSDELNERWKKRGYDKRQIAEDSLQDSNSDKVAGIIIFIVLLIIETYIGDEKYVGSPIPQLIRLGLIFSVGLVGALFTRKEGDNSIKATLIFLSLGFMIVLFAAVPRYLERGFYSTVDMILLKQNILGNFREWGFSFKSNFYLSLGYTFIAWAFIDNILRIFPRSKMRT